MKQNIKIKKSTIIIDDMYCISNPKEINDTIEKISAIISKTKERKENLLQSDSSVLPT